MGQVMLREGGFGWRAMCRWVRVEEEGFDDDWYDGFGRKRMKTPVSLQESAI